VIPVVPHVTQRYVMVDQGFEVRAYVWLLAWYAFFVFDTVSLHNDVWTMPPLEAPRLRPMMRYLSTKVEARQCSESPSILVHPGGCIGALVLPHDPSLDASLRAPPLPFAPPSVRRCMSSTCASRSA
jgi:hypothetical protein